MISKQTIQVPSDLCGVWIVRTFHLYGGSYRRHSKSGEFTKVSVRRTKSRNFIKKKKKSVCIVLRTRYHLRKKDGSYIRFRTNNCVLLKRRMTPRGRLLYGPVTCILRRRKFIASFANKI